MKNFTKISFDYNNLDRYLIRKFIKEALDNNLNWFKGKFLDVGCGKMPYKEYLLDCTEIKDYTGLDIENAIIYDRQIKPDVYWDAVKMPFKNSTFDLCMATEVLEHCPNPEIVLNEIYRVLKPKGIIFFTVPFLWNLYEAPHDEYRYTPFSLERYLLNSGFKEINIKSSGGWHASLAMMLGLWVRRSPMGSLKRKILSRLVKPIMKILCKRDIGTHKNFIDGQMIPNLFGTAKKTI